MCVFVLKRECVFLPFFITDWSRMLVPLVSSAVCLKKRGDKCKTFNPAVHKVNQWFTWQASITQSSKKEKKKKKRKKIHVRFQKEGAEYTFELFVFRHRSNLAHNAVLSFITTWLEAAIPTHSNPHHSSVSFIILPNKLLNRPGVVTNASQPNTKKQIYKNKFIWG